MKVTWENHNYQSFYGPVIKHRIWRNQYLFKSGVCISLSPLFFQMHTAKLASLSIFVRNF